MVHDTLSDRLARKTAPSAGCLIFTGATNNAGYGVLWNGSRPELAHRVAYRLAYGDIPSGLVVRHDCDRPACVEPTHLRVGTVADNLADMRSRHRESRGPRHAAAIRAGWTPEVRTRHAEERRTNAADRRRAAAIAAGVPEDWKRCPRCGQWKPRTGYQKNAARRDGLKPYCAPCAGAVDVERRGYRPSH